MHELLSFIAADAALESILETVRQKLEASERKDPGHDLAHLYRVASLSLDLAGGRVDRRNLVAAALLHDYVNVPKSSPDRSRASELCADAAHSILLSLGFAEGDRKEICEAIRDHSFSRGDRPASLLGQILQDADRLEALGAVGVLRAASIGTQMGSGFFDAEDPWAARRSLDDRAHTVDHFFTKLLKLPETMNTPEGRAEAEKRAEFMRGFLRQLGREIGHPLPG